MAEKKTQSVTKSKTKTEQKVTEAAPVGNPKALRWGAVAMWVVALGMEVIAYFLLTYMLHIGFLDKWGVSTLVQALIFLVIDFILVVVGAQLWKKANHIDPVSEKNKVKFWLWNNMGVIACAICFIPFIIMVLTNKDIDEKSKKIASIAAIALVLIGGVANYDWNPVSAEQKQAAVDAITSTVYWADFGKVYHTHEDCQAIKNSAHLTYGNVEQAIAEGRTRLCSFCAKADDITTVATDDAA